MTPRQLDALKCIAGHTRAQGYAPTVRELGAMLGTKSVGAAVKLINSLVEQQLLTRPQSSRRNRNLAVTARGEALLANLPQTQPDQAQPERKAA